MEMLSLENKESGGTQMGTGRRGSSSVMRGTRDLQESQCSS